MQHNIINAIKVSVLAVVLSFGLSYALAWTAPASTPPAGNAGEPINTSATAQTKSGSFTVGTTTVIGTFGATGDVCTSVTGTGKCLSNLNPTILGGFLLYAIHTFQDCTTVGGTLYSIGGDKNVCNIPSALPYDPSAWTQYQNLSATQNVYCVDISADPIGCGAIASYPCNTGSHTYSNTPTESCNASTDWDDCTYSGVAGASTVTTCYATFTRVAAY